MGVQLDSCSWELSRWLVGGFQEAGLSCNCDTIVVWLVGEADAVRFCEGIVGIRVCNRL